MKNFKIVLNEVDYTLAERKIEGRLTKKRWEIIRNYVKRYNYNNESPYGVSPNGYSYNCGCEHDCCGCLSKRYLQMLNNTNKVVLQLFVHYNY
jgi:hypothetical protein